MMHQEINNLNKSMLYSIITVSEKPSDEFLEDKILTSCFKLLHASNQITVTKIF